MYNPVNIWLGSGYYFPYNGKYYFAGSSIFEAEKNMKSMAYECDATPSWFNNRLGLSWKDVFDCGKRKLHKNMTTIYDANMFVQELGYLYFAWSDRIYKVQNPFSTDECDTNILVSEL